MSRKVTVAIIVVAALVIGARLLVNIIATISTEPPQPRYPPSSLSPLPPEGQNAFIAFSAVASKLQITPGIYDRSVLDGSWRELRARKKNGLNLDFDKDMWAASALLDQALVPGAAFVENCEPGTDCEVLAAFHAFDLLILRALVLANRSETDAAVELALRLRLATAQWANQSRSIVGLVAAIQCSKQVEQLLAVLVSDGSPAREAMLAETHRCADVPLVGDLARVFKFEAASFYERATRPGTPSSYWLLDWKESQAMIDACVTLLISTPGAECSYKGLDDLPNWLHNKKGRVLAASLNVVLMQQAAELPDDVRELDETRADAMSALGCQ